MKFSAKYLRYLLTAMFIVLLPIAATASTSGQSKNSDLKQGSHELSVRYSAEEIKQLIVSANMISIQDTKLQSNSAWISIYFNISNLLYAFDSATSQNDLKILASLSSYYIGEGPTEVYNCLLINKGEQIKPILLELLKSKYNECRVKYGHNSNYRMTDVNQTCMSSEEFVNNLNNLIERIANKQKCNIKDIG